MAGQRSLLERAGASGRQRQRVLLEKESRRGRSSRAAAVLVAI
jgi:hypothetical protein